MKHVRFIGHKGITHVRNIGHKWINHVRYIGNKKINTILLLNRVERYPAAEITFHPARSCY